jgi:hypothetical protein
MFEYGPRWFSRTRGKTFSSSSAEKSKRPRRSTIMALEPRMMYDAAAAATVGAAAHHHHHQDGAGDHANLAAAEQSGQHSHRSNSGQGDASSTGSTLHHPAPQNVQTPTPPPAAAEDVKATPLGATGASAPAGGGSAHEIVFIDSRVTDYQVLVNSVKPGVTAVVLDPGQDGLTQIADYLSAHPDSHLATIDIVAHGAQGELLLGSTTLTDANLPADAGALQRIGDALAPGGAIALYGCNVASGTAGLQFISDLSKDAGGAAVAAATHDVGAAAQGGSWDLDTATGRAHIRNPFTAAALEAFPDLLTAAPPVLTVSGSAAYVERATGSAIEPALTVADVDSADLVGATVTIAAGLQSGDTLHFTNQNGISGSYDAATGVLTLSGTASVADYQAALRSVSFDNLSNHNPTNSGLDPTRTIDWQVNDGTAVSGVLLGTTTTFAVGQDPVSIATGDFNGDGVLDLVVANQASNTVSVLLGNGSGGFGPAVDYAVGSAPSSVAAVDLNGDGRLDLVVANTDSNSVSVLLGNGSGGFAAATNFATGSQPVSVAFGDLNGDGKLDLVVADRASNDISVLLGDGSGGFAAAASVATGSHPVSVALGDFNGDGRLDIAEANEFSNDVRVMLGDGIGGFGAANIVSVGAFPNSLVVGDLNGDGKLDLVTANGNDASVLLGDGHGGFAAANTFIAGAGPTGVAIGDFNGDGRPDLAITDGGSSSVSVLLGDGNGGFAAVANLATGAEPLAVAIGDFNGDGAPDLAIADFGSGNVSILQGSGLSAIERTTIHVTAVDGANVPQPPFTGNSAITPQHLFTDNSATTPTQSATPASLVVDSDRSFQLAPPTGGDGFGTGGGYGFHVVHTDAVLTTASDATVQINLALAALEAPLGGDIAMVVARQANGDPLPEWLKFDPATGSFAGLPPDNAVASIEPDQSADNSIVTGALPPNPDRGVDMGAGPNARVAPNTITVEVLARDSKGNIAVTVFTIDLRAHTAGKQGWNLDRNEPSFGPGRHALLPMMSPELAAIEAAVRDAAGPFEPFTLRGLPVRHGDSIAGGISEAAPTGRAGLTEQLASIGWRSMDAQRNSLLASLQQRS